MYIVDSVDILRGKKYSVTVKKDDFSEKYEISEDIVVEFRLVKNKELNEDDFQRFITASKRDIQYQKVLHYSLYKMRCEKDILDYLDKKRIPSDEHNYYIEKLKKSRILDDDRYAEIYIRENFDFKKIGPNKLIYELNQKCIDKSIYQKYINLIKPSQIRENISYLFNKKLDSIRNKTKILAIQNIKQYIVNKGYDYEMVNSFVDNQQDEVEAKVNESELLKKDFHIAIKKYSKNDNTEKNILAYLLRKGHEYSKIKAMLGEYKHEKND